MNGRNDTKPWYASRTIWGAIASIISGAALLAGIEISVAESSAISEALLALGSIIGGVVSAYGRKVADRRIK